MRLLLMLYILTLFVEICQNVFPNKYNNKMTKFIRQWRDNATNITLLSLVIIFLHSLLYIISCLEIIWCLS